MSATAAAPLTEIGVTDRKIGPLLTIRFVHKDPELTPAHSIELVFPERLPVFITRSEARELARRITGFLDGSR